MKAIGLYKYLPVEHEECLVEAEVTTPEAKGYDLLVKVKAVSVNPVDTKIRAPKPRVEDQLRVLGWDACGEVVQVGEQCTRFKQGDKVFYAGSITRPGSNSQYQLVDERIVGKKPESLSYEQAVALPLTSLTAWEALFERMDLTPRPSERNDKSTLLIIGGAGGVGSIATQLAKRVAKTGTVITTASRKESREWCGKMGADFSIDHNKPLMEQLNSKGISGVDYIFCCSATEHYFDQMAEIINPQGSICTIVETKGDVPLPMNKLQAKSVRFCWELMFTRSLFSTKDIEQQHQILTQIAKLADAGVLETTTTANPGPLTPGNLIAAHKEIESGGMIGKLVLSGIPSDS